MFTKWIITAIAALILVASIIFMKAGNPVEEAAELVIQDETGYKPDLQMVEEGVKEAEKLLHKGKSLPDSPAPATTGSN